ncbi:MAG TPA: hypothetical protein PK640_12065 [Verrucomicrobiota bacterium]|nr:hypothetical protein [Verrucomicrobiota bacterium]
MRCSSGCRFPAFDRCRVWVALVVLWAAPWASLSQGLVKVYDQVINYGMPDPYDWHSSFPPVRTNSAFAQSFEPTLDEVGFVEIAFRYGLSSDSLLSETLYLNLREGSVTGPILGSTPALVFTHASGDPGWGVTHVQDFLFPEAVGVNPGEKYFIEVVHVSGDDLIGVAIVAPKTIGEPDYYPSGELFLTGRPYRGSDMWFREGILIPEPGTASLMVLGAALLMWHSGCRRIRRP